MAASAVVVAEMFYLVNSRRITAAALTRGGLSGNRMVWIAIAACLLLQLAFVHASPLQAVFGTTALQPAQWAAVALAGLALFVIAEVEKLFVRRLRRRSTRRAA